MSRLFYHVMQDSVGNLLFDVSGTMRLAGTGTAATIYGDEALTVIIANPMTNHPSFGSFKCFLPPGDFDFYMAKAGYTFETLTGVQGYGTMAQQDANAVAITGGNLGGVATIATSGSASVDRLGVGVVAPASTSQVQIGGHVGVQFLPQLNSAVQIGIYKSVEHGLSLKAIENDAGTNAAILFLNVANAGIGSITTTATATAYNTTSDARLKHAITPLTGAMDVIRALNPVSYLWNADDSEGRGFIASEVQAVVPEAVTGEADAVDEEGRIVPQQMDLSKLVPYLVGACQALAQQVQVLTARLDAVGG